MQRRILLPSAVACISGMMACGTGGSSNPDGGLLRSYFRATGSMAKGRYSHTATLLPNGTVLVAGGDGNCGEIVCPLDSAELYDPMTGTFSATGSMTTARRGHTATLLPNGKLLVAGGYGGPGSLVSAELCDPATDSFSATGNMTTSRGGNVLILGGYGGGAEFYDAAAGTFSATGTVTAGVGHTATLLSDGKVLIAGGDGNCVEGVCPLDSAELYDPVTGTSSATGSMGKGRAGHTATLLSNGRVLIAGGIGGSPSAELYDPATGSFSATGSMTIERYGPTATRLSNGTVLVAGGFYYPPYPASQKLLASAELYDPAMGSFGTTGSMTTARVSHTATKLSDGRVLFVGGCCDSSLSSAELFDEP